MATDLPATELQPELIPTPVPGPGTITTTGTGSPEKLQARTPSGPLLTIYTVMLMLSAFFLVVACLLLGVELSRYGFQVKPSGALRASGGEANTP